MRHINRRTKTCPNCKEFKLSPERSTTDCTHYIQTCECGYVRYRKITDAKVIELLRKRPPHGSNI